MAKAITEEKELTLQIEGEGNTKDQALGAAFSTLQKKVGGTPLRIEPLNVEVLQATETQYTERFLFLLFPRTRSKYYLRLNVQVRVIGISLNDIDFQVQKTARSLFR